MNEITKLEKTTSIKTEPQRQIDDFTIRIINVQKTKSRQP